MVDQLGYLGRSLNTRAQDVAAKCELALERMMREANAAGRLASGYTLNAFKTICLEQMTEAFSEAATFAFNLTESNGPDVLEPLRFFAGRIEKNITDAVTSRGLQTGIAEETVARQLSDIKDDLRTRKEQLVDDFEHGMQGNSRLKKDPLVSVIANQTGSPGAIQQIGVGTFSQNAFAQQHAPLIAAIDDALKSAEYLNLEPKTQQGFEDVADIVREEASKQTPNVGKLQRWSTRLLELAQKSGMKVAESTLTAVLIKIFLG